MVVLSTPKWVRWWYRGAAIYGLVVLVPLLLTEPARHVAVPRPENFYGFVGTAIAFQLAFWVIGGDPVRYRPLMPASVVEKFAFVVPIAILFAQGRVGPPLLGFGLADLVLGIGFVAAHRATPIG